MKRNKGTLKRFNFLKNKYLQKYLFELKYELQRFDIIRQNDIIFQNITTTRSDVSI